jgi:uncharacterized membrane protein
MPHGERDIAGVVHKNIESLLKVRKEMEQSLSWQNRVAQWITSFTGSMAFVLLHLAILGAWAAINLGLVPGMRPFDPYPFVLLAVLASVEAIFLSTFVLISQNRMAEMADRRAELDLQINLLAEHEITRLIQMVEKIGSHLQVDTSPGAELDELKQDIDPKNVWDVIVESEQGLAG